MNSQLYNTYQNQNEGKIGIINKIKETNRTIKEPKGDNWNIRVKEERGTATHKTKTMRIIRIKAMEGDSKEHVLSLEREDTKWKTVGIIQKNAHLRPEWWNKTQNSPLIQNNMENQSQDIGNQSTNTQSQTQNETGSVTWSNQEESDEASVEYVLSMVDKKIESTTPEAAIFEDVIEEDNDQDSIEEEDNNNICLFEFEEEEVLMNEDT